MDQEDLPEDIWDFCFNISSSNATKNSDGAVFWLEGIGLSVTSLIGVLGNSITVAVLNRISLNNVFNQVKKSFYAILTFLCINSCALFQE